MEITSKHKPDGDGIYHVSKDVVANVGGWWHPKAIEKGKKMIDGLEIPWDELDAVELSVVEAQMIEFSERLAKISHYVVKVNNLLVMFHPRFFAAKEALEQGVNRRLALDSVGAEGKQPAIALRTAAAISRQLPFRQAKIEIIELGAAIKALEATKESLEHMWATVSRMLSARLKEPID